MPIKKPEPLCCPEPEPPPSHIRALEGPQADQELATGLQVDLGDPVQVVIPRTIAGMGALLRQEGTTCAVTRMRVHPDAQRRGHGRRILRRLEARAVRLGYERLVLETTERQVAAISLYRSEGYAETGRGVVHGFHCILYAKSLPGRA